MARGVIEFEGTFNGYPYMVVMTSLGHRCGYVGISKDDASGLYGEDYEEILVDCHGGLTFAGEHPLSKNPDIWWIGFDCAHFMDAPDYDEAIKLFKNNIDVVLELGNLRLLGIGLGYEGAEIRTKEFCIDECKAIIRQIEEKYLR